MTGPDKKKTGKVSAFFKMQNWFVSAAMVVVLYGVLLLTLSQYPVDVSGLYGMFHALPAIAVLMVILGIFEKRRTEKEEREKRRKRYETTMYLSRLNREQKSDKAQPPGDNE